jgi:hypothetical protein
MIITTFTSKRKKTNQNNINISNEGLLNLTPWNVTIHKKYAYGLTISKFCIDGIIY